jgi:F0F1-type ATP synthase alpha subunit
MCIYTILIIILSKLFMLLVSRNIFTKSLKKFNTNSSKVKQFGKAILNNHGYVETLSSGIINAKGLNKVASGELVKIWPSNVYAIALNLSNTGVGLVLCGSDTVVNAGNLLARTGSLISIPVSFQSLGLAINPLGYKLGQNVLYTNSLIRKPIEAPAPVFQQDNQFLNHYLLV